MSRSERRLKYASVRKHNIVFILPVSGITELFVLIGTKISFLFVSGFCGVFCVVGFFYYFCFSCNSGNDPQYTIRCKSSLKYSFFIFENFLFNVNNSQDNYLN